MQNRNISIVFPPLSPDLDVESLREDLKRGYRPGKQSVPLIGVDPASPDVPGHFHQDGEPRTTGRICIATWRISRAESNEAGTGHCKQFWPNR
ncbi:unnamed protein product, partial [Nesidiocoris tenuis]